jgi:hypothetical protein
MRMFGVLFLAVACSGDHKATPDAAKMIDAAIDAPKPIDAKPIDAPSYDFSCAGQPLGSAAANVTISGTVEELNGESVGPGSGVSLAMLAGSNSAQLATTGPTGSDGDWAFAPEPTGGSALDVYIEATVSGSGERPSFVFPAQPLVADEAGVPVLMVTNGELSLLSQLPGFTQNAGSGLFLVQVIDCKGTAITTANLVIEQNGSALSSQNVLNIGEFDSSFGGTFLVVNVPPGPTTVGATYLQTTLAPHVVTSFVGGDTETQVEP